MGAVCEESVVSEGVVLRGVEMSDQTSVKQGRAGQSEAEDGGEQKNKKSEGAGEPRRACFRLQRQAGAHSGQRARQGDRKKCDCDKASAAQKTALGFDRQQQNGASTGGGRTNRCKKADKRQGE